MNRATVGFILSLAAITLLASTAAAQPNTVKTATGTISGVANADGSVISFRGIPYAAPPVGDLRWRAPEPASSWSGVRDGARYGASCPQSEARPFGPYTKEFLYVTPAAEDCLYLNVWTPQPNTSANLPVLVYIHGGGYDSGSGDVPIYEGEGLARKGVVAVTINYRLGVLGFLVHPELSEESPNDVSGNYGLLDQIAALKWVQANIDAFGGDPSRVTIAGQSAGGGSVLSLIASPLARGLFHRAIVESGGATMSRGAMPDANSGFASAEVAGRSFAESKGAQSIADLRAMDWKTVLEGTGMAALLAAPRGDAPGTRGAPTAGRGTGATAGRGSSRPAGGPIVDGYVLPLSATDAVRQGRFNDVPVLSGMNTGELGGLRMGPTGAVTVESYLEQARQRYGSDADRFLELYPAADDEQAAAAQAEANRDQSLVGMYLWARQRSETSKTKAFQYLFDHTLPGPNSEQLGAFHTAEVPYVMNTLYTAPERPFTDADREIADRTVSYWANFAANGDPNGNGLPAWPAHGEEPVIMELGDKNEPVPVAGSEAKLEFFESVLMGP